MQFLTLPLEPGNIRKYSVLPPSSAVRLMTYAHGASRDFRKGKSRSSIFYIHNARQAVPEADKLFISNRVEFAGLHAGGINLRRDM